VKEDVIFTQKGGGGGGGGLNLLWPVPYFNWSSGANQVRTDSDAKEIVKFVVSKTAFQMSLVVTLKNT